MMGFLNPYTLIAAAIILAGLVGYFYYSQDKIDTLTRENLVIQVALEGKEAEITVLLEAQTISNEAITTLAENNRKADVEIARYLAVFKRHNLNRLADAKPGLVEKRVNAGTKALFEELIDETTPNITTD